MKKFILSIAIFFLISTQTFGHVAHYAKYNYLEYELFRNNISIGYHKYKFNRDAIKEMGFDIDNPAYEAVGNFVSGTTNVPLDRVIANLNNVRAAMDKNNAAWQRISVLLGWNAWDVGIPDREVEKVKQEIKKRKAEERKRKKSKK